MILMLLLILQFQMLISILNKIDKQIWLVSIEQMFSNYLSLEESHHSEIQFCFIKIKKHISILLAFYLPLYSDF